MILNYYISLTSRHTYIKCMNHSNYFLKTKLLLIHFVMIKSTTKNFLWESSFFYRKIQMPITFQIRIIEKSFVRRPQLFFDDLYFLRTLHFDNYSTKKVLVQNYWNIKNFRTFCSFIGYKINKFIIIQLILFFK